MRCCLRLRQVLHDAFFKYQTKPKMTGPGEMYYEGKEFEAAITHARPGAAVKPTGSTTWCTWWHVFGAGPTTL